MIQKFAFSILGIIIGMILSTGLTYESVKKIKKEYHRKKDSINLSYDIKIDSLLKISRQKNAKLDSIRKLKLYTPDELTQKTKDDEVQIRYIVRDYRADQLDSIIVRMFSDLNRFNKIQHN